ncbi:MAG: Wzz/FepE/Etk N-terminal domain-containing protein [Halarcobacter sp.]
MQEKQYLEEDEIDLRELFKTVYNKRWFIFIFTMCVTLCAIIYAFSKTPLYEVNTVVRIGYIKNKLVEESKILEEKLRLIFNVNYENENLKNEARVSNIKSVKGVDNFLKISTQASSNEEALSKNKEVLTFLQNEYQYKIDENIFKMNLDIKNLEEQIDYIEKVEKVNLQKKIERIRTQSIPKIDEKINLIKTQEITKLNKQISLIKNVELKIIDKKLEFSSRKLKEYENFLMDISKNKSSNNTQNMLMSMQSLNIQNVIFNIPNIIEDLKRERKKLLNITIKDLENKKENLLKIKIKDLELEKQNLINDHIRKLEINLNIDLKNKINMLKDEIQLKKLNLTNNSIKNSEVVGTIQVHDYPIKPKKKLIVIVSFITGLILSIFIVFFMNFVNSLRKEEPKI